MSCADADVWHWWVVMNTEYTTETRAAAINEILETMSVQQIITALAKAQSDEAKANHAANNKPAGSPEMVQAIQAGRHAAHLYAALTA